MTSSDRTILGTLCKRNHDHEGTGASLRHVRLDGRFGDCVACRAHGRRERYAREAAIARSKARAWYTSHKVEASERSRRYYVENRHALLAYQAEYRRRHVDEVAARKRQYYQANVERLKTMSRDRYAANRDAELARRKLWRVANRDALRAWWRTYASTPRGQEHARRSAAKYRLRAQQQRGTVTLAHKERLLEVTRGTCLTCGVVLTWSRRLTKTSCTWDHVVPLSRGGRDDDANLVPLCHSCNTTKNNRTLVQWLGHDRVAEIAHALAIVLGQDQVCLPKGPPQGSVRIPPGGC